MEIECRAGDQDVYRDTEHAHRLPFCGSIHRRELDTRRINHGNAAAARGFERIVRADECRRVFVQPQANGEWIERQRRQQATQPIALAKMLVNDEAVGQPEPGARRTAPATGLAPSSPKAIMCSLMNAAPALVPAMCTPPAFISRSAFATEVPPRMVESRN